MSTEMRMSERRMNRGIAPQLLKSSLFWTIVRGGFLVGMLWCISILWGHWRIQDLDVADPLMYTNLGNTLFWVVWMMGLVLLVPAVGRAWCAVCPLGALNEIVSRWGMAKPFPRFLRNDYPKAAFLLGTLVLLGLFRIHHYPGATALFLVGWTGLAVLAGMLFSGRSLCSYLCPVGGMLNLYTRTAPVGITIRDLDMCVECDNKECVSGSERWIQMTLGRLRSAIRYRAYPCPVNLKVWDMKGSGRCLFCLNCMRACPYDNVQISARSPFTPLWKERFPRFSEVAMAAALMGFLLLSYSRFWPGFESVLALPLAWASPILGPGAARVAYILWVGFILPMLVLITPSVVVIGGGALSYQSSQDRLDMTGRRALFPVKFWMGPSTSVARNDDDDGDERIITQAGSVGGLAAACLPSIVPLLLAAHLVLAIVKLNAKAGYLALGMADPAGIQSYLAVEELGLYPRPGLLFSMGTAKGAAAFLMAGGVFLSLLTATRIARREDVPLLPFMMQIGVAGLCFTGGLVKWLF
ncbi:4Fe-4S binding protein [bacterium]|nr:MAG: 4Fe-4S binding protein [bacterium]